MAEVTRAAEVAAALKLCSPLIEEWNYGRGYLEEPRHCEAGDALCRHINTLAALLSESQPEPAPDAGPSRKWLERMAKEEADGEVSVGGLACDVGFPVQPEPAPVGGDEEALLARWWRYSGEIGAGTDEPPIIEALLTGDTLASRLTAALADVARLTDERDRARLQARSFRQSSHDHNVSFRRADVERLEMRAERDKARAALAAAEQEKEKAVAEEREACARTIEKLYRDEKQGIDDGWDAFGVRRRTRERDAAAIRARAGRNDG